MTEKKYGIVIDDTSLNYDLDDIEVIPEDVLERIDEEVRNDLKKIKHSDN